VLLRWAVRLVLAVAIFAAGVALGRSLEENPDPGVNVTNRGTLTFTIETE
jgi:hypothetical protein